MPDPTVILGELAENFTAKVRTGQTPDIESYATQHPELADRIRELFPALMLLEGLAAAPADATVDAIASDPMASLPPGTIFGQYRIVREIARGGMGIVYEAEHLTLHRQVALKVLPIAGPQAAKQLERFLREAKTAAGLHHTNIVPVFDVGQVRGTPYYAMQYINGEGLDRVISSSALSASSAVRENEPQRTQRAQRTKKVADIGIQAAAGLAHAHQRGVIHRDIKPSNLLLDDQGVVWITDFGLARRHDDVSLTHSGQIIGTPRYMSPEQAGLALKPLDHRTDIYSLGATLYELLTGRPAFDGPTPQDVVKQIIAREPIRPRQLDPHVPRDLETIVMKAMAKRPEDRYPTAQALADDLQRFTNGEPIQARRIGIVGRTWRWAKREPVVAGLVGAVILSLVTGVLVASLLALQSRRFADQVSETNNDLRQLFSTTAYDAALAERESDHNTYRHLAWMAGLLRFGTDEDRRDAVRYAISNTLRHDQIHGTSFALDCHANELGPLLRTSIDDGRNLTFGGLLPIPMAQKRYFFLGLSGYGALDPTSKFYAFKFRRDTSTLHGPGVLVWSVPLDRPISPSLLFNTDSPLARDTQVTDFGFTDQYVTVHLDNNYCTWRVSKFSLEDHDFIRVAELLAGRRITAAEPVSLTSDQARLSWNELKSRYSDVFSIQVDELLEWHLKDDSDSVLKKRHHVDLFAANFDCRDRPNDPHPFVARGRLFTVLGEWDKAEADFAKAWQLGGTGWVKSECRRLGRDALNEAKEKDAKRQSLEVMLRKAEIASKYLFPVGPHCWARLFARHRLGLPVDATDQATLSWLLCGLPMAG